MCDPGLPAPSLSIPPWHLPAIPRGMDRQGNTALFRGFNKRGELQLSSQLHFSKHESPPTPVTRPAPVSHPSALSGSLEGHRHGMMKLGVKQPLLLFQAAGIKH